MNWCSGLVPIIFLSLWTLPAFSQVEISGKVSDTLGKPLGSINVLIYPRHSGNLNSFGFTDEEGKFKIWAKLDTDSLDIIVSSIHYEKIKYTLPNQSQWVEFVLSPDVKLLETITVRAKPIEQRGDTISYLVGQFVGKEDNSIADVLRKLPGIEVEESGKILYQGLPINKFYVEGLDLTDGRYSMISNNLPHTTVSVVEVFENHQPIRILEDRVYSQQAAINLKLKKEVAFTGRGKVATGFSPWLWDVNLTPMLLSSRFQLLASYQTNNTGNDVSRQLQQLIPDNDMRFPYKPHDDIQLFDAGPMNQYGAINQKRYLDNQIHLANFNALIPLKKDLQLRANIYFVDDRCNNESAVDQLFLLPDDTLSVREVYYRKQSSQYWLGSFDLNRNTSRNYLNNKTQFKFNQDTYKDLIINSEDSINQRINSPFNQLSNKLNSIFRAGKSLIEFQSLIRYDKGPQNLSVSPGRFESLLNNNQKYDVTNQDATIERVYLDHYAGSNIRRNRWVFSLRVGFAIRQQQLNSRMHIQQSDSIIGAGAKFENQLNVKQYQFYSIPAIEYKHRGLQLSFIWSITQQQLNIKDEGIGNRQIKNKLLQAPQFGFRYTFGGFWELRTSWNYFQRMSDPDDFYYSYMLKNYRELIKKDALIQRTNQHIAGFSLFYRNSITAFFNTMSYYFVQRGMNLLYSNQLQDDGSFVLTAIEIPNTSFTHSIKLRSSKFIAALKSSISLSALFMTYSGKTLVNEELFDSRTSQYSLVPEIYFQTTSWMNFSYKFAIEVMNSKINEELRNQIKLNKHFFSFNVFPRENQMLNLNLEYYVYNQTRYNFVDLMYRYSIAKTKFDIELRWNNVFNSKTYVVQQLNQFIVTDYKQMLRPSQLLLGLKFSF
ncbi:MAG: hypothetical protein CO098_01720 [Bacteroidetes bacterium CG_4_9_14_3_um_filter_41_19]|nr:MAG: hypothetical protein CO098_01720 [Bacteroidetes bacterium CG_4_9_14_3_um_filter_41_19]